MGSHLNADVLEIDIGKNPKSKGTGNRTVVEEPARPHKPFKEMTSKEYLEYLDGTGAFGNK